MVLFSYGFRWFPMDFNGVPFGFIGFPIDFNCFLWISVRLPKGSNGLPTDFHGFPKDFHGFPIVFNCFPLVILHLFWLSFVMFLWFD